MRRRERVPGSLLRLLDHSGAFGLGASVAWLIRGERYDDRVEALAQVVFWARGYDGQELPQ